MVLNNFTKYLQNWVKYNIQIYLFEGGTSENTLSKPQPIPKKVIVNCPSELPNDYSTTPGGTMFSTTPGGKKKIAFYI